MPGSPSNFHGICAGAVQCHPGTSGRSRRIVQWLWCGGIPDHESAARHPLQYMITWSFEHVLREYMVDADYGGGQARRGQSYLGTESFRFAECGVDEMLECAITPGMPSFHPQPPQSFAEKTIRWPGHWQAIDTLKDCGLRISIRRRFAARGPAQRLL